MASLFVSIVFASGKEYKLKFLTTRNQLFSNNTAYCRRQSFLQITIIIILFDFFLK